MRLLTTILLALAAAGFGLYAYLDQSGTLAQIFGQREPPQLLAPVPKAITGFAIVTAGETRTLEKREGRWYLATPVVDRADPKWVRETLQTLGAMRKMDFVGDTSVEERASFGLSQGAASTLSIDLSDHRQLHYRIGRAGPYQRSTYLSPGTSEEYVGAFIVTGDFTSVVETPATRIVDPLLARFDQEKIVGLSLSRNGESIELKRKATPGSRWRLEEPIQHQADDDEVNALLLTLATLPVSEVILDPDKSSVDAGRPGSYEVDLWEAVPKNVIKLTFSPHPTDADLLRAKHSTRSLLYDLPKSALEAFPRDAVSLRERRLLRVIASDVTAAALTRRGGAPLRLENPGAWLVAQGDEGMVLANQEQGERFIALLNETIVDEYLGGGPGEESLHGLEDPLFTVEFEGENLGPLEADTLVMRVGSPAGDESQGVIAPPNVFVRFDESDHIAAVPTTFLTGLAQAAEPRRWKKLEVLNVAFELIEEAILAPTGGEPLSLKIDFTHADPLKRLQLFQNEVDRSQDMDRPRAGQVIRDLGNLSADLWVTPAEGTTAALSAPSLRVTLRSRPAEEGEEGKQWQLSFAPVNPQVPKFYYGRLEETGGGELFLIRGGLYDRLSGKGLLLEAR